MNQSSDEKNGWSAQTRDQVPPGVAPLASFTAALVASEPFLANFTMSAAGDEAEEALRALELDGDGR